MTQAQKRASQEYSPSAYAIAFLEVQDCL